MMDTPAAEVVIDEALVRKLLAAQHPDLADRELRLVGNGWDNAIIRLGDDLVVRLPRRQIAAALIEHEQRWLPELASRVSIPIPTPVRTGKPSELFLWHWTIAPWFDGEPASWSAPHALDSVADDLALFLRQLHVPAPGDAPFNPVRSIPLATRADAVESRLSSGLVPDRERITDAWQQALAAPAWTGGPIWLHGDLHPANILVRGSRLAAIVDFGDVCSGDPATDLACAWLTLSAGGRARFRSALDYDDATWTRAIGWAILMGTTFLTNSGDDPRMMAIGTHSMEQVLLG